MADTPTANVIPKVTSSVEPSPSMTLEVATKTTTASETPTPAIDSVGPWLVYSNGINPEREREGTNDIIFLVNKDGMEKTAISVTEYKAEKMPIMEDVSNRLVVFSTRGNLLTRVYHLRPFQSKAFRLTYAGWGDYVQPTTVAWNGESGHMASSRQVDSGVFAEVVIHTLPGGATAKAPSANPGIRLCVFGNEGRTQVGGN